MKKNSQEKRLITVNENSIFYKIKTFLKNLFNPRKKVENVLRVEEAVNIKSENQNNIDSFIESIRNIENEETKLLKLQQQYRRGEIKEETLTKEQVNALCSLYDKQIANLRKSNEIRKKNLLEYKKKLQTDN
jgi:hypothetical protein